MNIKTELNKKCFSFILFKNSKIWIYINLTLEDKMLVRVLGESPCIYV